MQLNRLKYSLVLGALSLGLIFPQGSIYAAGTTVVGELAEVDRAEELPTDEAESEQKKERAMAKSSSVPALQSSLAYMS